MKPSVFSAQNNSTVIPNMKLALRNVIRIRYNDLVVSDPLGSDIYNLFYPITLYVKSGSINTEYSKIGELNVSRNLSLYC